MRREADAGPLSEFEREGIANPARPSSRGPRSVSAPAGKQPDRIRPGRMRSII